MKHWSWMKYWSLLSILLGSRCLRSFTDSRHQMHHPHFKTNPPMGAQTGCICYWNSEGAGRKTDSCLRLKIVSCFVTWRRFMSGVQRCPDSLNNLLINWKLVIWKWSWGCTYSIWMWCTQYQSPDLLPINHLILNNKYVLFRNLRHL